MKRYEDIINLKYTGSRRRNKMSLIHRAAQFSPFSTLAEYNEAIHEVEQVQEVQVELGEAEIEQLNYILQEISERISEQPLVQIIYYKADQNKRTGTYETVIESVKRIDEVRKEVVLTNNEKIQIDCVLNIGIIEPD